MSFDIEGFSENQTSHKSMSDYMYDLFDALYKAYGMIPSIFPVHQDEFDLLRRELDFSESGHKFPWIRMLHPRQEVLVVARKPHLTNIIPEYKGYKLSDLDLDSVPGTTVYQGGTKPRILRIPHPLYPEAK